MSTWQGEFNKIVIAFRILLGIAILYFILIMVDGITHIFKCGI